MGNRVEIEHTATEDQHAVQVVAKFRIKNKTDEYGSDYEGDQYGIQPGRSVIEIANSAGESPGYAIVRVPVATWGDEAAPAVAMEQDGPVGNEWRLRARASIGFIEGDKYVTLLTGHAVSVQHNLDTDEALVEVVDDRWLLTKYTVWGRAVYDPRLGRVYFDAGRPCIFNNKAPDCMDSPNGPRFAPAPFYGWTDADTAPPAHGEATTKARPWRARDCAVYLADMYRDGQWGMESAGYGLQVLPEWVHWADSLFDFEGNERYVKGWNVENMSLLQALSELGRKGGPYSLLCMPLNEWDTELSFADMNPKPDAGYVLYTPSGAGSTALLDAMQTAQVIAGGYVKESIINHFDGVTVCGDPPALEGLLATTDDSPPGVTHLEPAWDDEEETAFKKFITDGNQDCGADTQAAFDAACQKWPNVYCAYRTKPGERLFAGTKWQNRMLGGRHARFWPTMLSSGLGDDLTTPGMWLPRPVFVECKVDGTWTAMDPEADGLELMEDDTVVRLPGLRKHGSQGGWTWNNTDSNNPYKGSTMESRNVRMNAAIEGDWRITGRSRGDPNKAATRISEEPSFTYVVAGERQDYVDWLRKDSYPLGYQGSNALQLADQCTADNELISDVGTPGSVGSRIAQHADKRNEHLNRVEHSGQLRMEGFNIGLAPGLGVELRGAHTLPMRSVIQTVVFSAVDQTTTIDLAAPDNARIYDGPSIVASAEPASEADKPQKATESKAQESGYDESGYGDTEKLKTRQMPETFEQETKSGPLMNRPRPGERSRETKGETDEETRGKARGKEVTTDDARKKKWGKEWKDGKLVDRKPQGLDSDVQRKRAKEREARAAEQAAYDKHIKEGGRPGDFSEAYQQRKSQYDAVHKKHEKYRSKKAAADEAQDERRRNLPRTDPKAYRARMAGVEEPAEKKAASRRRLPEDVMPDELTDERRY